MAAPITATNADDHSSRPGVDAPELRLFVMALFFIFGGITSLNDVILPKLKELFTLSFSQAMLVQFCFFTAYLVIGIPGAALVKRIGYMKGAVAGLLVMLAGCLLFIPASQNAAYALFLTALFVLASGVVIVQVVANPLISLLGRPETTHSRLTFAQAFNSLGTTVFPYFGSVLILGSLADKQASDLSGAALAAYRTAETQAIVSGYLGIAVALGIVAAIVWMFRNRLPHQAASVADTTLVTPARYAIGLAIIAAAAFMAFQSANNLWLMGMLLAPAVWLAGNDLLRQPRFAFGALSIFVYVGAEVAIGSLIVNYLMQSSVLGLGEEAAGKLIALYWGGAMVGRFIGSYFLRIADPAKILAGVAVGAIVLILVSTSTTGVVSGYALLAIGLMNAIMFPTIFSLACEGLGARAADGSGIINIAIFGGAVVPLLTGMLADATGSLGTSLLLPAACYAVIAAFGLYARRRAAPAAPALS